MARKRHSESDILKLSPEIGRLASGSDDTSACRNSAGNSDAQLAQEARRHGRVVVVGD